MSARVVWGVSLLPLVLFVGLLAFAVRDRGFRQEARELYEEYPVAAWFVAALVLSQAAALVYAAVRGWR